MLDKTTELNVLYRVLKALKIFDIHLDYDVKGNLVAKDEDNQWTNKQFYEFLVEDAIAYDDYGKPIGFPDELVRNFTSLAEKYGVEVKDYNALFPLGRILKAKK